jgi:HEXXH motif-containing protein
VAIESTQCGFGSSSTLTYPGRTIIINPFRAAEDASLMETMLHEAIHSFIYEIEATEWLTRGDEAVQLRSPWTGNPLPLHAFVHACFVWFGLWHFWLKAVRRDLPDEKTAKRCLVRAAHGFVTSDVCSTLKTADFFLRPGVIDACAEMQDEVRSMFA